MWTLELHSVVQLVAIRCTADNATAVLMLTRIPKLTVPEGVDWIQLAQDGAQDQTLLNTLVTLPAS
jgi:hypothetical protein